MVSHRLEEVLIYLSEGLQAKVFDNKTMEELKILNTPRLGWSDEKDQVQLSSLYQT